MPLIGTIDSSWAQLLLSALLEGIARAAAETVIIDLTGVRLIDASGAGLLFNAAYGARLFGTTMILTGIQPEVAQTLVSLGIGFEGMVTLSTLQSGVAHALRSAAR